MLRVRVIPVLLLRRRGLVKTVRFTRPEYVGDPINIVKIFNAKEVDELSLLDIVATRSGKGPDFDLVEQIASEAFMPLSYGGAVRTVADARRLLRLGVEKIILNTAALTDPNLVRRLADELGSQCVVVSVDVKRSWLGRNRVFSHAGVRVPEPDPVRWVEKVVKLGAGEVVLNSVDRDGMMAGYDDALLRSFRSRFDVPIVALGGAGGVDQMVQTVTDSGMTSLGVGARFIYEGPYRAVLVSYLDASELLRLDAAARSLPEFRAS